MKSRRTALVVGAVVVGAIVVGLVIGRVTAADKGADRAESPLTSPPATATASPVEPSIGAFVGQWSSHDFGMMIDTRGGGTFGWRTFAVCGTEPPPCDYQSATGIFPGGHASFVLSPPIGETVSGQVFESNQPKAVPTGSLTMRLDKPDDMIYIVFSDGQQLAVCGTNSQGPAAAQC